MAQGLKGDKGDTGISADEFQSLFSEFGGGLVLPQGPPGPPGPPGIKVPFSWII